MINGYKSITETSEEWGISSRRIQVLCTEGRIEGAAKIGRMWVIPIEAAKPKDAREKSGLYKNWRKKTTKLLGGNK